MSEPRPALSIESANRDDDTLVSRIRAGDSHAFETLFDAYFERLCAFAERYVRSAEAAEDVVMEMFHRCWVQRQNWHVPGTVRSYLYRAVANASLNEVRNRGARARLVQRSMFGGDGPPGMAIPRTHDGDLARAIRVAVDALPPRCRAVFVLKWEHGLTYQEIAEVLGISIKTVEMQMTRAAKALRPRLAPYR